MEGEQTVEDKAKNLGWTPREEFKGDPEKWIDAEQFVERGEHIMPILKANNQKLQSEVLSLRGEIQRVNQILAAGQEAIEELKKFHSEDTERQVKKARKDLMAELRAAKREGDTDKELDIQEELDNFDEELRKESAKVAAAPIAHTQPVNDPMFVAWQYDNPWFGVDKKKTALMIASAEELRADPKNNGLVGKAFYEAAAREADKVLNPQGRATSKVESASGRSSVATSAGRRSFADLPAEAKNVCERQAKKLVGEGRAFKTMADWQKHYVEQYFLGE